MNAVRVQYTVKEAYAETNKANIRKVMADLQKIDNADLRYITFVLEDGKTFVHFAMRANEEAQRMLNELPSFQEFQRQLMASDPETKPAAETLNLVGSSWEVF